MIGPTVDQVARGVQAIHAEWRTCDGVPTASQLADAVLRTLDEHALAVDAQEKLRAAWRPGGVA